MSGPEIQLGVIFPHRAVAGPDEVGRFASAIEAMGYAHVGLYDHVLGAPAPAGSTVWPYTERDRFHEVLVLAAYVAALTSRVELMTEVMVLPQRQTALVAKQAAEVSILSRGRFHLGVGIGWNHVEYEALGRPFAGRGARLEFQVALLKRLWRDALVDAEAGDERVRRAGLNPLVPAPGIPIWIGGSGPRTMERVARLADGWMAPAEYPLASDIGPAILQLRELGRARARARDLLVETRLDVEPGEVDHQLELALGLHGSGVTHLTVNTFKSSCGDDLAAHLDVHARFMAGWREALPAQ